MTTLRDDLMAWWADAAAQALTGSAEPAIEHVGTVTQVGDGVARVTGLPGIRLDEVLLFVDGTLGLALRVEEDAVSCALLGPGDAIAAGSPARGTGDIIRVPVGEQLLGRVLDPTGKPLDGGPALSAQLREPIDRPAPSIVDRDAVTQPLMTGLTVVDAMIPLGRGQRELIIGDRKTGKTAIAVDTIISQRDTEMICVYAAIGQKASTVNHVVQAIREHGAIERCIVVAGRADAASGLQWITPYAACTMAEYFRDRGQDALLVIDDLTKHAIVYRQLSLLLRKPPGREAYSGDVFYVHARLLERAAKLSADLGGGSLSALPIAETQAGNLTAYVPTNLISITDGQIYLEPKLFYEGHKPAVNVGMSVSRVGGKTQAPAMKTLAEKLRLQYAQFLELEVFTRFTAMLDARTEQTIAHGRRIRAILAQREFHPLPLAEQVALLLAVDERKFADVPLDGFADFAVDLLTRLHDLCPRAFARLEQTGELIDEDRDDILAAIDTALEAVAPLSEATPANDTHQAETA